MIPKNRVSNQAKIALKNTKISLPIKANGELEKQPTLDILDQVFKYEDGKIVESDNGNEFDNEIN